MKTVPPSLTESKSSEMLDPPKGGKEMPDLREKFRGCIAASWIGSSMGVVVEGWSRERIAEVHGYLDTLKPFIYHGREFPPGATEDGIERQKLIATAIIEKKERILAHDLISVWLRDVDPQKLVYKQEPFDRSLLEMARAGVPPVELGRLWPYPNVISMGRASHPIGLINAGDPESAANDTFEVGKVYGGETTFGLRWAALYNASIAEACKPGATVDSVVDTAKSFIHFREEGAELYSRYDTIENEVERAFELAEKHSDPMALRDEFYRFYEGTGYFNYHMSQANEVISKGLAIFAVVRGDPKAAILAAVNFGRDTDCLAAVAGGLSGALSGAGTLPEEWIQRVNAAAGSDPYTNSHRTIEETADGLYRAFQAKQKRLADYVELMAAGYRNAKYDFNNR
jgi:ADP-ribosylglycohydrolase